MSEWTHKDEWRRNGAGFTVTIEHYLREARDGRGPHRWNVYAYIYPQHPRFLEFRGLKHWQEATRLPLHGGCTLLTYMRISGDDLDPAHLNSVMVGCDYGHDGDERHTHNDIGSMNGYRHDADRLFAHLQREADAKSYIKYEDTTNG